MFGCLGRMILWFAVFMFAMIIFSFTLGGGELTDANIEMLATPAIFIAIFAFGLIFIGSLFS